MKEIKYKPNEKVVFLDTDKIKLISGRVCSINAIYRKTEEEEYYTNVEYSIQTEKTLYMNIKQDLLFYNKKEFYNIID